MTILQRLAKEGYRHESIPDTLRRLIKNHATTCHCNLCSAIVTYMKGH